MPVEIIVFFFVLIISLINSKFPMSNDATLKIFTSMLSKKFTDSISKGVEKKLISFFLQ